MSAVLDTLIWLIDVPIRNGLVFVILGIMGGLGALVLFAAAGRERGRPLPGSVVTNEALVTRARSLLAAARAREGLPRATNPDPRGPRPARIAAGALVAVLVLGGVFGMLGLANAPIVRAYVFEHGVETAGQIDGEWVTFTTEEGATYRVRSSFLAPATYPARDPAIGDDPGAVTVRYLSTHPQAFVVVVDEE